MATYGYVRVSSVDQNEDRQLIAMKELNIPAERIFTDKRSGKDTDRPQLKRLLAAVKQGDTITVESVSRFARNTRDLLDLVERLTAKGVEFVSLKEQLKSFRLISRLVKNLIFQMLKMQLVIFLTTICLPLLQLIKL